LIEVYASVEAYLPQACDVDRFRLPVEEKLDMSTVELDLDRRLDVMWVRSQFPSLAAEADGQPAAFLDAPAGTQVPTQVISAIQNYLLTSNANTHGAFQTSRRSDEMIAQTRVAMGDLFHSDPAEVVFGQNMTTLTFAMARAIGRELKPDDEIWVKRRESWLPPVDGAAQYDESSGL